LKSSMPKKADAAMAAGAQDTNPRAGLSARLLGLPSAGGGARPAWFRDVLVQLAQAFFFLLFLLRQVF